MLDGDRFLAELKERADRVKRLHIQLTVLFLPIYKPDELEILNYYQVNKN